MVLTNKLPLFYLVMFFITSCGVYNPIYFDIKTQSIISCSGRIERVIIETPKYDVVYKGPIGNASVINLDKINPSFTISINGDVKSDYILKLMPNVTYTVKSKNGPEQGPCTMTFTTDANGKVVSASNLNCN